MKYHDGTPVRLGDIVSVAIPDGTAENARILMATPSDRDSSNGYEAVALEFMRRREQSGIGVATVRAWARSLKPGASILDLGCGHGVPISAALMQDGFLVYGIDSSPSLTTTFRNRFPRAQVACEAIEDSNFFGRQFDAVIAIGLLFLLCDDVQARLIRRIAQTLNGGAHFLFTSPAEACTWEDVLTGQRSQSLGAEAYKDLLSNAGLTLLDEYSDEGDNHYYASRKR
jgi:2-polyprenyl-3-methyl-5-hydroxy-6-metoxy-1,4-benzoquinol methylase